MKLVPKKKFLIQIAFLLFEVCLYAGNPPSPKKKGPPGPPGLSIDEGIIILLILLLAYTFYKLKKVKNKTAQNI